MKNKLAKSFITLTTLEDHEMSKKKGDLIMKKTLFSFFCILLFSSAVLADDKIEGYWITINEKSKKPESLVAIYPYNGVYYGRIIATFEQTGQLKDTLDNRTERAPGVKGNPYYVGLDFINSMVWNGRRYTGKILDPQRGKIYNAEIWRQGDDLIVRGKLLGFGRNQTWIPFPENKFDKKLKKPDVSKFVPIIPIVS